MLGADGDDTGEEERRVELRDGGIGGGRDAGGVESTTGVTMAPVSDDGVGLTTDMAVGGEGVSMRGMGARIEVLATAFLSSLTESIVAGTSSTMESWDRRSMAMRRSAASANRRRPSELTIRAGASSSSSSSSTTDSSVTSRAGSATSVVSLVLSGVA
jgi:hypothetical protein